MILGALSIEPSLRSYRGRSSPLVRVPSLEEIDPFQTTVSVSAHLDFGLCTMACSWRGAEARFVPLVPAAAALVVEEKFGDGRDVDVAALTLRTGDARLELLGNVHDGLSQRMKCPLQRVQGVHDVCC
jgi:hypothetical protein